LIKKTTIKNHYRLNFILKNSALFKIYRHKKTTLKDVVINQIPLTIHFINLTISFKYCVSYKAERIRFCHTWAS